MNIFIQFFYFSNLNIISTYDKNQKFKLPIPKIFMSDKNNEKIRCNPCSEFYKVDSPNGVYHLEKNHKVHCETNKHKKAIENNPEADVKAVKRVPKPRKQTGKNVMKCSMCDVNITKANYARHVIRHHPDAPKIPRATNTNTNTANVESEEGIKIPLDEIPLVLKEHGIRCPKTYKEWMRLNHTDKGGKNTELIQEINNAADKCGIRNSESTHSECVEKSEKESESVFPENKGPPLRKDGTCIVCNVQVKVFTKRGAESETLSRPNVESHPHHSNDDIIDKMDDLRVQWEDVNEKARREIDYLEEEMNEMIELECEHHNKLIDEAIRKFRNNETSQSWKEEHKCRHDKNKAIENVKDEYEVKRLKVAGAASIKDESLRNDYGNLRAHIQAYQDFVCLVNGREKFVTVGIDGRSYVYIAPGKPKTPLQIKAQNEIARIKEREEDEWDAERRREKTIKKNERKSEQKANFARAHEQQERDNRKYEEMLKDPTAPKMDVSEPEGDTTKSFMETDEFPKDPNLSDSNEQTDEFYKDPDLSDSYEQVGDLSELKSNVFEKDPADGRDPECYVTQTECEFFVLPKEECYSYHM